MQLLDALELSRLTMKTVKQNLWWAFAYNIVSVFPHQSIAVSFLLLLSFYFLVHLSSVSASTKEAMFIYHFLFFLFLSSIPKPPSSFLSLCKLETLQDLF